LVNAGWGAYLELVPGESNIDEDRFALRLLKAHWFFKVVMEDEGRTLKLLYLSDSWIEDQIQQGKLAFDHETIEDKSTVMTASTSDLQQLLLEHLDDEEAFAEGAKIQRQGSN